MTPLNRRAAGTGPWAAEAEQYQPKPARRPDTGARKSNRLEVMWACQSRELSGRSQISDHFALNL